jgi:hypothetical protein
MSKAMPMGVRAIISFHSVYSESLHFPSFVHVSC